MCQFRSTESKYEIVDIVMKTKKMNILYLLKFMQQEILLFWPNTCLSPDIIDIKSTVEYVEKMPTDIKGNLSN